MNLFCFISNHLKYIQNKTYTLTVLLLMSFSKKKKGKMALVTPLISAVAIEDKVLPLPKKITDNIFIFTSIYFLN